MANIKITDLTAYTDPAATDVLPIVDVGADVTKKISIQDLLENAGSGTAAAPGIAFDGDSDTGIYRPGADQLALSTNGVQRINIEADGDINIDSGGVFYDATNNRLGIGTTSPIGLLDAKGSNGRMFIADGSASNEMRLISQNTAGNGNAAMAFQSYNLEYGRFDTSGRLLVGTSSSLQQNAQLQVVSAVAQVATLQYSADNGSGAYLNVRKSRGTAAVPTEVNNDDILGGIVFQGYDGSVYQDGAYLFAEADGTWTDGGDTTDNPTRLTFSTTADGASSPTERMRITNSGDIVFTTRGLSIEADGSGDPRIRADSNPITVLAGSSNGVKLALNAGTWTNLSDENVKTDLVPIENATEKVKQVRTVTGRFITDDQDVRRAFLIAQDFQSVLPEAVVEFEPGKLGLNYTDVIPLLAAAFKEAIAKIETLEASNADLLARVSALEAS